MKGRERQSAPSLQAKTHSDSVVALLGGVADRDAALALRGSRVYVSRSEFPALEADEFYWVDLLGLDVVNLAGVNLGKVADMIDNGAHSVLRIEYAAADKTGKPVKAERLIPFVGVFVKTVDQAAKQIIVDWEADY
jgi:16S rRNA processing protein RimM